MLAAELGLTGNEAPFLYAALPKSYISWLYVVHPSPGEEKNYGHILYLGLNINSYYLILHIPLGRFGLLKPFKNALRNQNGSSLHTSDSP